ncbi:hypothetical protein CLV31_109118 [Algoriphagus aquaeductus]|uniref:ParE-like toxin of type II ParDE toxin-antitoxin system n=1 Tax=Algoriphagus aquaeductus TaxID=475299 RepID=A0A326RPJ8_9BACT|nr:hypothetical protein CLV31_109118 [Algoriphagus aquaeductus]
MGKRKLIWSHLAKIRLFEILDFYTHRNKALITLKSFTEISIKNSD